MSSNSITFWLLNTTKKCSSFIQVAAANAGDSLQYTYHAWKWDSNVEYLGKVTIAISSHLGTINFVDQTNIREVHKELISLVRTETIHISNKYKTQTEPTQFEWDKFLPTLRGFPITTQ